MLNCSFHLKSKFGSDMVFKICTKEPDNTKVRAIPKSGGKRTQG